MARSWLASLVILVLAAAVAMPGGSHPAVASSHGSKKKCHTVTKKVHGKKKKVKVCTKVKPTATVTPTATPSATPTPTTPTIKEVAGQRGINVAVTVSGGQTAWPQFATTLANNFNTVNITDTDLKNATSDPDFRPDPNTYRFDLIDPQVQFALNHGMKAYMHILVGIGGVPDWLKNGHFTQDQLRQVISDEVNQVMGRYRGKVANYTVVTEPMKLPRFGGRIVSRS